MNRITVLLAEDHRVVREGFRSLLEHESDIEVVGEAATGREAIQLIKKLRPAVVVMDIAMPLLNGLEATRQIRANYPQTKVIILSAHKDEAYVERSAEFGAVGFLIKQTSSHVLAEAIREVQKGNTFFNPAEDGRCKPYPRKPPVANKAYKKKANCLSSREVEVLQLIAEGLPNKQVASELGVTFKTVDRHRQNLMTKLDIHDVAGLTRYAIAEGIIVCTVRLDISR